MTARQQRRLAERKARKAERKAQDQNAPAAAPESITVSQPDRTAINRANAQRSTGPKTAEGKLASSRNSFKHGLYAKQLVLPGEDPAELDALREDLRREHRPATPTEEILVNELAEHFWRLRRMRKFEARAMGAGSIEEVHKGLATLPIIQRTMAAAERGFHKALTALRQLQKERQAQPEPVIETPETAPAGFVPQNSTASASPALSTPPQPGFVSQDSDSVTAIPAAESEQHYCEAA